MDVNSFFEQKNIQKKKKKLPSFKKNQYFCFPRKRAKITMDVDSFFEQKKYSKKKKKNMHQKKKKKHIFFYAQYFFFNILFKSY